MKAGLDFAPLKPSAFNSESAAPQSEEEDAGIVSKADGKEIVFKARFWCGSFIGRLRSRIEANWIDAARHFCKKQGFSKAFLEDSKDQPSEVVYLVQRRSRHYVLETKGLSGTSEGCH